MNMIKQNPLFSKDSLKDAATHVNSAAYTLIYDANELSAQEKAGRKLKQATWILALIMDHIFDYYPYSYFMNDDDRKEFPEYLNWFKTHPHRAIENALEYVKTRFSTLETVTRDELNQHRIPHRNLDKEAHVIEIFEAIKNNQDEIFVLLSGPKKVTDPEKPTAELINSLILSLKKISSDFWDFYEQHSNRELMEQTIRFTQMIDMFINPLLMAWEKYHYGSHDNFWQEGDSMFGYMMFEINAKEIITDLIKALQTESPFAQFERDSRITNGLLKVYNHLNRQL